MRILFITNVFPNPYQPTKGVFNRTLARALAHDHELSVVAPIFWTDEWRLRARRPEPPLSPDRRVTLDDIEIHHPIYYYTPKVLRRHYGWFFWQSARKTVVGQLNAFRPDVILSYWVHPDGETAIRAGRLAGKPVVLMTGGSDVLLLTDDPARKRCIQRVLRDADAVVAVSQDLAAQLVQLGIDPRKVRTMARGVDLDQFAPGDKTEARERLGLPSADPVLLWVGRMVPVKGLDVLIAALDTLRHHHPDARLYLVGDGPLRHALAANAAARGLERRITFVGAVPHDDLADWYRAADLTVLPSHSEGSPNVLRESLACGTPFVASRVGGVPDLAINGNGTLVPPGDPAALAQALESALRSAARAPRPEFRNPREAIAPLNEVLRRLVPTPQAALATSSGACS